LPCDEFVEREFASAFRASAFAEAGEVIAASGTGDGGFAGPRYALGALGGCLAPDEDGCRDPKYDRGDAADEETDAAVPVDSYYGSGQHPDKASNRQSAKDREPRLRDSRGVPLHSRAPEQAPIGGHEEPGDAVGHNEDGQVVVDTPPHAHASYRDEQINNPRQREHEDCQENSRHEARHNRCFDTLPCDRLQ